VGFDIPDQLVVRFSAFVRSGRKNGSTIRQFIDFNKAYDSERREVWYNILIGSGVPMKLKTKNKQTPWPLVRERTIPTDRPSLVDEI
jgi:hypothetical protein